MFLPVWREYFFNSLRASQTGTCIYDICFKRIFTVMYICQIVTAPLIRNKTALNVGRVVGFNCTIQTQKTLTYEGNESREVLGIDN